MSIITNKFGLSHQQNKLLLSRKFHLFLEISRKSITFAPAKNNVVDVPVPVNVKKGLVAQLVRATDS